MPNTTNEALVTGVNGNIVTMEAETAAVMKNEVAYVCLAPESPWASITGKWGTRC